VGGRIVFAAAPEVVYVFVYQSIGSSSARRLVVDVTPTGVDVLCR
jgi:hypothetical protein